MIDVRFKVDENLPARSAASLRRAGHDAMSVAEQAMIGADDSRLFEACTAEGRVLVTLDLDFADIRAYPPRKGPGVVVLRVVSQDAVTIEGMLARLVAFLANESPIGKLWILEQDRVRIRD
ncbi:MAG: DUF5615 family PIN-like protein [Planctomycetota bacterium]